MATFLFGLGRGTFRWRWFVIPFQAHAFSADSSTAYPAVTCKVVTTSLTDATKAAPQDAIAQDKAGVRERAHFVGCDVHTGHPPDGRFEPIARPPLHSRSVNVSSNTSGGAFCAVAEEDGTS